MAVLLFPFTLLLSFNLALAQQPLSQLTQQPQEQVSVTACMAMMPIIKRAAIMHVASAEPVLRKDRLMVKNFAESLQSDLSDRLDPQRIFLMDSESAGMNKAATDAIIADVFLTQKCETVDHLYEAYRQGVDRSLQMIPVQAAGASGATTADPVKALVQAKVQTLLQNKKYSRPTRATSESELKERMIEVMAITTIFYTRSLQKMSADPEGEAYDLARQDFDRKRAKTISKYDMPDLMLATMISRIDAHSAWHNQEETINMMRSMEERSFGGVGLSVQEGFNGTYVGGIIPNGPAAKAQTVKPGDKIIGIDNKSLVGVPLSETVNMLRGPLGSTVHLKIMRGTQTVEIDLVRGEVQVLHESVKRKLATVGTTKIGYVHPDQFNEGVTEEMLTALLDQEKQGAQGYVLDLRGNPGGHLTEAIDMVSLFVDQKQPGMGVFTLKGGDKMAMGLPLDPKLKKFNKPLIIMIDRGSASASEIVSGALQAYGAGIVIGTSNSFGKGSVQSVMPIGRTGPQGLPARILRLTTQLYYLPTGASIQYSGVAPDIMIFPERAIDAEYAESKQAFSLPQPPPLDAQKLPPGFDPAVFATYHQAMEPMRQKLAALYAANKDVYAKSTAENGDVEKVAAFDLIAEWIKDAGPQASGGQPSTPPSLPMKP